jgi:hypothetical protein
MKITVFWDVALVSFGRKFTNISEVLTASILMMKPVSTSEKIDTSTRLHGITPCCSLFQLIL